jgi:ABC-2 type transport system ATP-binding protein
MDEPTIGLDVMTARKIREFLVQQAREHKKTIFLATHNMVEGEKICDRVAIIDRGKIITHDSPESLKKLIGVPSSVIEASPPPQSLDFISSLPGVNGITSSLDSERELVRIVLLVDDEKVVEKVKIALESNGSRIISSWKQETTLEEVFVKLVGRGFKEREMEFGN